MAWPDRELPSKPSALKFDGCFFDDWMTNAPHFQVGPANFACVCAAWDEIAGSMAMQACHNFQPRIPSLLSNSFVSLPPQSMSAYPNPYSPPNSRDFSVAATVTVPWINIPRKLFRGPKAKIWPMPRVPAMRTLHTLQALP